MAFDECCVFREAKSSCAASLASTGRLSAHVGTVAGRILGTVPTKITVLAKEGNRFVVEIILKSRVLRVYAHE